MQEHQEEGDHHLEEERRLLYVALTRARRCVILSRTPPSRAPSADAPPSWWARLAPLAQDWPTTSATAAPTAAGGSLGWQPLPAWQGQPVPLQVDAAEDARTAEVGEALHRVLEWASQPGQAQPLEALLASSSQAFGLDAAGRQQLERSARAILASAEARPFFDPAELLWAGNEVAVTVGEAEGRIDRLVQRRATATEPPTWWVLDYKLGRTPEAVEAYHAQLRGYVAAVQALQPGESVRAALISGEGRVVPVA